MLKITTWNVENLFRPAHEDAHHDEDARYRSKLRYLAGTIRTLAPDVLGLQEVGGDDPLADLQRLVPEYRERRIGVPDERGIACAILSKLPIVEHEDIVAFPPAVRAMHVTDVDARPLVRMGRGALRVRVQARRRPIDLVVVHLKSKLLTFPGGRFSTKDERLRARVGALALMRRTLEAATVRLAVNDLLARKGAAPVVVLGDLNDAAGAATTTLLLGPPGSHLGTRGFSIPDSGDGARLWNLAEAIPAVHRYSRIFEGRPELLDHILVSKALVRRRAIGVDAAVDGLSSIDGRARTAWTTPRPDHAAVTATIGVVR